jgi:hypothetical protein
LIGEDILVIPFTVFKQTLPKLKIFVRDQLDKAFGISDDAPQ